MGRDRRRRPAGHPDARRRAFWVPSPNRRGTRHGSVVITEALVAAEYWVPAGVYTDHWTLREGIEPPPASELLTLPGVADLGRAPRDAAGGVIAAARRARRILYIREVYVQCTLTAVSAPPMIRARPATDAERRRAAVRRLAVTATAVALGVGMLLVVLAGINALNAQNARAAWLSTGSPGGGPPSPASSAARAATPDWWLFSADNFGQLTIDRVDVAATGPGAPVPPGLPHVPGPGQFYASRLSPSCCALPRPLSSLTASQGTRSARSARRRSRRRTR